MAMLVCATVSNASACGLDPEPDAVAAGAVDTTWMVKAKYGLFLHYQYRILLGYSIRTQPQLPQPAQMTARQWNRFVDGFDVRGFAALLRVFNYNFDDISQRENLPRDFRSHPRSSRTSENRRPNRVCSWRRSRPEVRTRQGWLHRAGGPLRPREPLHRHH
jgi:hypothetical protein